MNCKQTFAQTSNAFLYSGFPSITFIDWILESDECGKWLGQTVCFCMMIWYNWVKANCHVIIYWLNCFQRVNFCVKHAIERTFNRVLFPFK